MILTPEQQMARKALADAAVALVEAFSNADRPMVLSHYVLVTSEIDFDDEGDAGSVMSRFSSGGMTDWQAMGLLTAAVEDIRHWRYSEA